MCLKILSVFFFAFLSSLSLVPFLLYCSISLLLHELCFCLSLSHSISVFSITFILILHIQFLSTFSHHLSFTLSLPLSIYHSDINSLLSHSWFSSFPSLFSHPLLTYLMTGVNFINILRAAFCANIFCTKKNKAKT